MTDDDAADGTPSLSADELRSVFDAIGDAMVVYDEDGGIVDVNRAAAERYGYARADLRGADVDTIRSGESPHTPENATDRIERAARGEEQTFEWQGEDSDGTVFREEVSLSRAVVDGAVRVVADARKIDHRAAADRRFETLIENLPGIVYRCRNEPGWPMDYVGGRSVALTGYDADRIESGDVSWGEDVIHPDDRNRVDREVQDAVSADEAFEITYRIRTADGETRWVWERGRQIDATGSANHRLEGFITDVTDRTEYERQLEEQRDDLDVLNQVLRHDVRNDLQLVTAYANLLAERFEADDEFDEEREYVRKIVERARQAVELTKTARTMANVMLTTADDRWAVDLRSVLDDELEEIRTTHDEAVVTVDGVVPSVRVLANDMLGSVFRNLLENAIHHNDAEVPRVTVSVTDHDDHVVVEVADNGPGIPDAQKETIFGKGEKGLDSEGTGLGLYLVRTLVERYEGDVTVEDNDPRGAVLVVELPKVG